MATPRPRKKKPGKRVLNLKADRAIALEAAMNFVLHNVLRERFSAVLGEPVTGVENAVRAQLAAVPAVDVLKSMLAEDAARFRQVTEELDTVVARNTSAMLRSLTKEFEQAHKERRFRGLRAVLAGPPPPNDPERFYDEDSARAVLAEARAAGGTRLVDLTSAKPGTQTELRATIAKYLGDSERTIRRLEEQTKRAK